MILDCLRSALDALGLSEDKDAGRFLVAFDELLAEAGASEAVVIHHAGHGMERSRGDSRLRDWPDAEWRLVREKPEDGAEPEADARRFFTAFGRDVDVPEGLLEYNQQARRLTFAGGTRKAVRAQRRTDELVAGVIEAVTREPGATTRQLDALLREVGLAHQRGDAGRAARTAEAAGRIVRVPGPRGSFLHYLAGQENDRSRPFPTIPAGNAGAVVRPFPTAPIGSGERSTTPQPVGTPPFPPGTLEPTHLDANREPGDDDEPLPGEAEV